MSRYVDADKLLKDEITRCHCVPLVGCGVDNFKLLKEVLEEAPTADVVEVVRCRDCVHWKDTCYDTVTENHWGECRKPLGDYRYCETAEDDYCSYGERKSK